MKEREREGVRASHVSCRQVELPKFLNVTGDCVIADNWSLQSASISPPDRFHTLQKGGGLRRYKYPLASAFDGNDRFDKCLLEKLVHPTDGNDVSSSMAGSSSSAAGSMEPATPKAKDGDPDDLAAAAPEHSPPSKFTPIGVRKTISMTQLKDVIKKARNT